jgi:hypothetical protein
MAVVEGYAFRAPAGVKAAVDRFVASRSDVRLVHALSGQAVIVRIAPGAGEP